MMYLWKKKYKHENEQLEQEIAELQKRVVWVKSINNVSFTRQEIERDKVVKYYSNKVLLSSLDEHVQSLITVAMEDIPVVGQHLVITQFVRRQGDGFLIEIYQYNSNTDIRNQLNSAKYQVAYTKGS